MKFAIFALLATSVSSVYAVDCFCISTDDDPAAGRQAQRKFNLGGDCEARGGRVDVDARACVLLPASGAFTDEVCQRQSGGRILVANCVQSVF